MGRAAVEYPGHGWEMPTLDQLGIIMLLQLKKVEQRGLTRLCQSLALTPAARVTVDLFAAVAADHLTHLQLAALGSPFQTNLSFRKLGEGGGDEKRRRRGGEKRAMHV